MLCYHGVSATWPDPLAVSPDRLRVQVERLLRRGWRAATFSEAVEPPASARMLAVTFDDGLRSVARLALPVLRELGAPATVFVPTGFVGGNEPFAWPETRHWLDTEHAHELAGMSWDELAELRAAGWEVGSHSVTHAHLTELGDGELAAELRDSRQAVEAHAGPCRAIAYPYSDVDERVAAAARAAGYDAGAAVLPVWHRGDRLRVPRVPMLATEGALAQRLHLSRPVRGLQATRPWPAVQRAVRTVNRES